MVTSQMAQSMLLIPFPCKIPKEKRQNFWYKSDLFRIKCVKVMGTSWNGNLKKAHERNVNYRGLSNLRNV